MNTLEKIINYLTLAVTAATFIRVALYRAPSMLKIWIAESSPFWLTYAKMVETFDVVLGWMSGALAKFGKSDLLTPEHLEWLRDKTPPTPPPPPEPVAVLDAAKEEPAEIKEIK
jgi:hypothetical protein